jgi:hypothetical protein
LHQPHDRRTKPSARLPNYSSPPAELLLAGLQAHFLSPPPSGADCSRQQQPIQPAAIFFHRAHKVFDGIPQGKKMTKLDDLTWDWIVCLTVVVCIVDELG